MAIQLSEQEKRELAEMIKPMLQSGAVDVSKASIVDSLNGVSTIPVVKRDAGISSVVRVPVSLLRGDKGDKGDSIEFVVAATFPSLQELMDMHPNGANGIYKVGELFYVWTGSTYEPLNIDVNKVFETTVFSEVTHDGTNITIDFSRTPYAKVYLSGPNKVLYLNITNMRDGATGKILVHQSGFKQIVLPLDAVGTINLPLNEGTITMISYNRVDGVTYFVSNVILDDVQFPAPQKIDDLQVVYSDSNTCVVQWTAPWSNNIYEKADVYDMRYSNNPVNADDPIVWAGLKRVSSLPLPGEPGELQSMTITGLVANKEYYIYMKSVKVNYGVEYKSIASDFLFFRTLGSDDISKAYRVNISGKSLIPALKNYSLNENGEPCVIENIIDELDKNVYLSDGYPDTSNKSYTTFWSTYKYGRDTSPFHIIIDLFSVYSLDKLFVFSRGKPYFSVFGMKDVGYAWEKIGEVNVSFNSWKSIDFMGKQCRFIRLEFDLMFFGEHSNPPMQEGVEGFPEPEFNNSLDRIDNIILYGRPISIRPEGIMPPARRTTVKRSVDQFFCTNGHAYQQGRIHSMCSGEKVRMYIHFGHFAATGPFGLEEYTRVADMRFKVNQIPWVSSNNGLNKNLEDTLRDTYKRYGLKPYLCNTGVFDYCYYDKNKYKHNRPVDDYWLPGAWKPVPKGGVHGLDKYYEVTMNPLKYKTYAKLAYMLSAKYGDTQLLPECYQFYPESELSVGGLDLISGIEPENEPDQNWSGWLGHTHAEEYAALISAVYDGHCGSIVDENGNSSLYGLKKAGDLMLIGSGTAGVNRGYVQPAHLWWKSRRKDATVPVDAFSMHMYFSNIGNQGSSTQSVQYGITFEEAMLNPTGSELQKMVEYRNRNFPNKEIWITEFGWGESGAPNTQSKYQCYSQPGRYIGDWLIPDRHRSDVKGAWIVRACIQLMSMGVDMVNYYSTECEQDYFNSGQWGAGAGIEMFKWDECYDETPGAKCNAVKIHECTFPRGGFATTGLFGALLVNGGYPITRAYWWVATFRNRLKGYIYTGMKYVDTDNRIVVACFKNGNKGAYVVYLNDNKNTGVPGVEIPVPDGVTSVTHVSTYIPRLYNPKDVPSSLGYDIARTGLPTSRKERYIGGEWTVINMPYYQDRYSSYSQVQAKYPSNPKEGDEITILPSEQENPYFPIVGPVSAKPLIHGNNLGANSYEQDREFWQTEPNIDDNGMVIWEVKQNASLAWRQVDAICDYIEFHPEGVKGANGIESTIETIRGFIQVNVSEFPEFYFFDNIPDPDFRSHVSDLSSVAINSSSVELWFNNSNVEDTAYQVFSSKLPDTGYTLLKEVTLGVENKITISGLSPNTTYYYKVRPVKGDKVGDMSEYTSVKTQAMIPAPTNLALLSRSATSITLSWEYTSEPVADFVRFDVYRSDGVNAFVSVASIENISTRDFSDTSLKVGSNYSYKIRAVGLNGQSDYSEELSTRTLLPEECSPVVEYAITDKMGLKVIIVMDLPLGSFSADAKNYINLTEDGNLRIIQGVSKDEANPNRLIITMQEGTLKDYTAKTDIRVSYTGSTSIISEYNVPLAPFSGVKVANVIGNYSNIESTYKVNFCGSNSALPTDATWNNLVGGVWDPQISMSLKDTFGRDTGVNITAVNNNTTLRWGGVVTGGVCSLTDAPQEVYSTGWSTAYGALSSENIVARLQMSGLLNERRYTVKVFGGLQYGNDRLVRMKMNGGYSQTINVKGNYTSYLTLEDCQPSNGSLVIDFVSMTDVKITDYPMISYAIIEEYGSSDEPTNTDIYLRGALVKEDEGTGVTQNNITVELNYVGVATEFRISENSNLAGASWVGIEANALTVPYTLSSGFGEKTLYIQVRNNYSESNVMTVFVRYKDVYVPLALSAIQVNNGEASTDNNMVSVLFSFYGTPSYYKIGVSPDLTDVEWLPWSGNNVMFSIENSPYGEVTIYAALKDNVTTMTSIVSDVITYNSLFVDLDGISLNSGDETVTTPTVNVAFISRGSYPTHYRIGETADLSTKEWLEYAGDSVLYTFESTDNGIKTVFAQIKNSLGESSVQSDTIELVPQSIAAVLSLNDAGFNRITYDVTALGDTINMVRPAMNASYSAKQLKSKDGSILPWYFELNANLYTANSETASSGTYLNNISAGQPSLTGDDGVYPDVYIKAAYLVYGNTESATKKGRLIFTLPIGKYKIKALMSVSANSDIKESYLDGTFYKVNVNGESGTPVNVGASGFTGVNNKQFNAEIDIVVGTESTGNVELYLWNTMGLYARPAINLIEIVKMG